MNTWSLSWSGLRTVTGLEIKQRIRSKRWIWALVGWFVLLGAITTLVMLAAQSITYATDTGTVANAGPTAFAAITYLVLGMGLVIAPAFTATAINGDRSAGTLATLQATRLSALEIAAGKLSAAWLTATVFLVVASPFIAVTMIWGDISLAQVLVVFLVVLVEVAVVCAIGLGWSAIISRAAGSAMLTYLSVVFLVFVTLIAFALSMVLVTVKQPVQVWGLPPAVVGEYRKEVDEYFQKHPDRHNPPPAPVEKCTWFEREGQVSYTDRVWWLLLANPFIIVSDAAPLPDGAAADLANYDGRDYDPLAGLRYQVRRLSTPAQTRLDECSSYYDGQPGYTVTYDAHGNPQVTTKNGTPVQTSPVKRPVVNVEAPVWPWGLAFHLLLGAVFFWIAVRRLSVPVRSLHPGTRVA